MFSMAVSPRGVQGDNRLRQMFMENSDEDRGAAKEGKLNFFKDYNPEITYLTVFENKFSHPEGEEALHDSPNTDQEVIDEEVKRSIEESSKKEFVRPKGSGPCFAVNPLYNPRGVVQLCELCPKKATLCCSICTVTFYCRWDHWKRDTIHSKLCHKIKVIRWPVAHKNSSVERRRQVAQKLLVMEMLLDDLIHDSYLYIAHKRYPQALSTLLQCFKYVLPVYGPANSASQMVTLYTAMAETHLGLKHFKRAKKMLFNAFGASFKEQDMGREDKKMTFLNAQLRKTQGLLYFVEREYEESVSCFSEYIVFLSDAVGPSHIRVCMGYFYLGKSFIALDEKNIGRSLLSFCVDMWLYFLVNSLCVFAPDLPKLPNSIYFRNKTSPTMTRFIKQDYVHFFSDIWGCVNEEEQPMECVKLYLCQIMMSFLEKKKDVGEQFSRSFFLLQDKVRSPRLVNLWKHLVKMHGRRTKSRINMWPSATV